MATRCRKQAAPPMYWSIILTVKQHFIFPTRFFFGISLPLDLSCKKMRPHLAKLTVGLWVFYLMAGGCDISSDKEPIILPDVKDEFYVDLWEQLGTPGGRRLIVQIESVENKKCLNNRIDFFATRNGNRLKVSISRIIEPNDCVPGEAPVKANADIGSLPFGLYGFDIDFKGVVANKGTLTISSESYLLKMKTEHGIIVVRDELLRVPESAIWGYVAYRQSTQTTAAERFLSDLRAISTPFSDTRPGYYGYFTINPLDGNLSILNQPTDAVVLTFLFQFNGQNADLKKLTDLYRKDSQLEIKLLNARGEEF